MSTGWASSQAFRQSLPSRLGMYVNKSRKRDSWLITVRLWRRKECVELLFGNS